MIAPVASGWSDSCRVGLAPTEERRLSTAHTQSRHWDSSDNLLFLGFTMIRQRRAPRIQPERGSRHEEIAPYKACLNSTELGLPARLSVGKLGGAEEPLQFIPELSVGMNLAADRRRKALGDIRATSDRPACMPEQRCIIGFHFSELRRALQCALVVIV